MTIRSKNTPTYCDCHKIPIYDRVTFLPLEDILMKKNNKLSSLALILASAIIVPSSAFALSAGQDQIRLQTSNPKKNDESAFSYLVSWRKDADVTHRANGLTFIHGPDKKKPTTDVEAARKIAKSLNDAMSYESPHFRGAIAENTKGKPEVLISNKEGFDFTHVTFRDYSNQELSYNLPGKSFSSASVGVAFDLVYSAAVENLEGFSAGIQEKTNGGYVRVTIDNGQPIEVKTDGKTQQEVETELAQALGPKASFSKQAIYPNYLEGPSRNYKPFDGGEIQLLGLDAQSITVDISDSGLGVLAKFDFPDANKPADVASKMPFIIGALVAAGLGYFFYTSKKNKGKEEQEG